MHSLQQLFPWKLHSRLHLNQHQTYQRQSVLNEMAIDACCK